jgi:hypothetical protein
LPDLLATDRPLPAGSFYPTLDLLSLKRLSGPIFFDDPDCVILDPLVGGESAATTAANATPSDGSTVIAGSTIDHSIIITSTLWTNHLAFPWSRGRGKAERSADLRLRDDWLTRSG